MDTTTEFLVRLIFESSRSPFRVGVTASQHEPVRTHTSFKYTFGQLIGVIPLTDFERPRNGAL